MGNRSLEELFRHYAESGDEAAAGELVARTRPRLLAVARRIGDAADAEDSVQTAYLSLLHKRGKAFDAPIVPWLMTATVRIAYRAKAKRGRLLEVAERLNDARESTPAHDLAAASEERAWMRERVAELPASLRDPVMLHHLQGVPTADVGRLLGISSNAVKKRLQRARAILRGRWNPRLAGWLMAAPWWIADRASAAVVGGVLVKKPVFVVLILVALLATTVGITLTASTNDERRLARATKSTKPTTPIAKTGRTASTPVDLGRKGIVVTPAGEPVANALVRISASWIHGRRSWIASRDLEKESVRTDADGRFELPPRFKVKVTRVEYMATAPGFGWTSATAPAGEYPRIVLRPGGTLVIRPVDGRGEPTPRAIITVEHEEDERYDSYLVLFLRPVGRFDLPVGTYRVRVAVEGFVPVRLSGVAVAEGVTTEKRIALRSGVAYEITVVDTDGKPVPSAKVSASGPNGSSGQATTDAFGRCRIAGIASVETAGGAHLRTVWFGVVADGYAKAKRAESAPETDGAEELRFVLKRGARVTLRILNDTGAPIGEETLDVRYARPGRGFYGVTSYTTDERGSVLLPWYAGGLIAVRVPARDGSERTFELSGKAETFEIRLRSTDAAITGSVRTVDAARAVGWTAFLPAIWKPQRLDRVVRIPIGPDGTFRLTGLERGEGQLWVAVKGRPPQRFEARAPSEDVTLQLRPGKPVAGVVTLRDGTPVEGVSIRIGSRIFGWPDEALTTTNREGRFRISGVEGESLRIHTDDDNWRESYGSGRAVTPGETDLRLVVKPATETWGLTIPIHLTDDRGDPLVGRFHVDFAPSDERWRHTPIMANSAGGPGRYLIRWHGDPGTYDFSFAKDGYRGATLMDVAVEDRADNPMLEVRLDRGAQLIVVARYPDGSPVSGKRLRCSLRTVRTDDNGRAVFTGFGRKRTSVIVQTHADRYLNSGWLDVQAPATVEVVLRERARLRVKSSADGPFRWRLFAPDGELEDERRGDDAWAFLTSTKSGTHRVVVEHAAGQSKFTVDLEPGKSARIGP